MTILNYIYQYDLRMLIWCGKSRNYWKFMRCVRFVSHSGDGYFQLLLPPLLLFALDEAGEKFCWLVVNAFIVERALYLLLKNTLKRRRPPDIVPYFTSVVVPSDRFSFPSGHTMAAFLLASLCYFYFGSIALPLFIWASAVGASRVLLGVHFPTDILVGATIGILIADCALAFIDVRETVFVVDVL